MKDISGAMLKNLFTRNTIITSIIISGYVIGGENKIECTHNIL